MDTEPIYDMLTSLFLSLHWSLFRIAYWNAKAIGRAIDCSDWQASRSMNPCQICSEKENRFVCVPVLIISVKYNCLYACISISIFTHTHTHIYVHCAAKCTLQRGLCFVFVVLTRKNVWLRVVILNIYSVFSTSKIFLMPEEQFVVSLLMGRDNTAVCVCVCV